MFGKHWFDVIVWCDWVNVKSVLMMYEFWGLWCILLVHVTILEKLYTCTTRASARDRTCFRAGVALPKSMITTFGGWLERFISNTFPGFKSLWAYGGSCVCMCISPAHIWEKVRCLYHNLPDDIISCTMFIKLTQHHKIQLWCVMYPQQQCGWRWAHKLKDMLDNLIKTWKIQLTCWNICRTVIVGKKVLGDCISVRRSSTVPSRCTGKSR